jgi:hypothetical protein
LFPDIDRLVKFLKMPSFGTSPSRLLKDRSNLDNDVKFCRTEGIGPDKLLYARYNCCRLYILPMALGTEPDNLFRDRLSSLRPFILLIDWGMLHSNKLLSNLSCWSAMHPPIVFGISPENWFPERTRLLRFPKLPTSEGSDPDSELYDRFK